MIVYKSRRFATRRHEYGGSGIADMIESLGVRYATKAMSTTAAKMAMRGTLNAAKKAVLHLIADKVASTIAAATTAAVAAAAAAAAAAATAAAASAAAAAAAAAADKEREIVDIDAKHSQEPQLKKAFVDTGGININAVINRSDIVLN